MRKTRKRQFLMTALATVMSFALLVGCGSKGNDQASGTPATTSGDNTKQEEKKSAESITLKMFMEAKEADNPDTKKLNDDFTAKTGIKIEPVIVPGEGPEIFKKIDIAVTSGDETDIINLNILNELKYAQGGWLIPMDDMIKADNYDVDKIYGKYLARYNDKVYTLPVLASQWAVFYNKKIFDDAGVPYPKGEWTWDEYIETAKKLTNKDKGIYGSYMLDYDVYMYMLARQNDVPGYKADGTSNYDDPLYKESLKFFGDLGNTHKIQPSWLEFKTKKLAWDGFTTGNYGMHFIGDWYLGVFTDKANYPLDWKWGITQIPTDGKGKNNLGVSNSLGISKNSKHPKEAYEYIKFIAENRYKYKNQFPARVDLQQEDYDKMFKAISDSTVGDVTVEDLKTALIDNNLGFVQEKIIGPAATEYGSIILEESEKYLVGQKSLDEAIAAIKKRADEAIQKEKALK